MNWSVVAKTTAISLSSALVSAFSLPIIGASELLTRIIPLIISIIPPSLAMSLQVTKTTTNQTEAEKNASIYYLYDYDISTLQSELEETIRALAKHNWKVIFVIDELDKIDYMDVINVIKSLKTLFNQASALFVLITGEEFFKDLVENSSKRPTEYTLFPQKIFLQRPPFSQLNEFINKILVKPNSEEIETKEEYRLYKDAYYKFRNYVCYASKTDYFDLYNILRNYMSYEGFSPRLNIMLDKKLETSANLQVALEAIYIRKKLDDRSDSYRNELLLDKMYGLITKLAERKVDIKFLKIEKQPQFKIIFLNEGVKKLKIV